MPSEIKPPLSTESQYVINFTGTPSRKLQCPNKLVLLQLRITRMDPNVILSFNNEDFFDENFSFIQQLTKAGSGVSEKVSVVGFCLLYSPE